MEFMVNLTDAWITRLVMGSLYGALIMLMMAGVFRFIRPSASLECWCWRLGCVKLIAATCIPFAIGIPLLPATFVAPSKPTTHLSEGNSQSFSDQSRTEDGTINSSKSHRFDVGGATPRPDHWAEVKSADVGGVLNTQTLNQESQGNQNSLSWPHVRRQMSMGLGLLWAIGVGVQIFKLQKGWRHVARLRRIATPLHESSLIRFAHEHARRLGLRRPPRLLLVPGDHSPRLIGVSEPCILLSSRFLKDCSSTESKLVIGHEVAHVARNDLLWNWCVALTQGIFFFHPAMWWVSRRVHVTQEIACDNVVLSRQHVRVGEYAALLLKILMMQQARSSERIAEVGASGRAGSLEERLLAMKRYSMNEGTMKLTTWSFTILAVMLLLPWKLVAHSSQVSDNDPIANARQDESRTRVVTRSLSRNDRSKSNTGDQQDRTTRQRGSNQDAQSSNQKSSGQDQVGRGSSSSHASASSSSSGSSFSSDGTSGRRSSKNSNISRTVSFSEDGQSISIKQRGDRFTVERTKEVDGKAKTEKFNFASARQFEEKMPREYKRFNDMTSAKAGGGASVGGVKGRGVRVDGERRVEGRRLNPAQEMLIQNLRKMREEHRDNPRMQKMIDQMIADVMKDSEE